MRKSIIVRLLLLVCGAVLFVLPMLYPQRTIQNERTLNTNDKTDAFVPGDVLEQTFSAAGAPEGIDIRLETAASASGKIELVLTLLEDGEERAAETLSLAKKKAKSWLSLTVPAHTRKTGNYTLRIEVQGEGSVKLGGGASDEPLKLNGEAAEVGLDLRIQTTVATRNEHIQMLGVVLALLALIPIGGRRKQHA